MVDSTSTKSKVSTRAMLVAAGAIVVVVLVIVLPLTLRDKDDGSSSVQQQPERITNYEIYVDGPILEQVQLKIDQDGKTFVDQPMKSDPSVVYDAFLKMQRKKGDDLSAEQLQIFVSANFAEAGSDLKPVQAPDWQATPPTLDAIQNQTLKDWALALNEIWNELGREPVVNGQPQRHSFLETKQMLVVPGGRFRESYYWDSYWIVLGLIASDMAQTAKGVTQNLLDWVEEFGFVPNGGRIYYATRSQPPVLSEMVRVCHEADSTDMDWFKQATATLDKEYEFWMTQGEYGHAVEVDGHVLNRYVTATALPRPESYKEDVETAQDVDDPEELYRNLRAAAESGWDFSSRWMEDPEKLSTTIISKLLPVDLNTILHRAEKNLMAFHRELGQSNMTQHYSMMADKRQSAMDAILWDGDTYMWRDYNFDAGSQSSVVAASNYYPLWSTSFNTSDSEMVDSILQSFMNSDLIDEHALKTTTLTTGQQWDGPNAWPPVQDIVIEGLLMLNHTNATATANSLIQRWVRTGLNIWTKHGVMVEKYDAVTGDYGAGGEYDVQLGFGWSNGLILKFLTQHEDLLTNLTLIPLASDNQTATSKNAG